MKALSIKQPWAELILRGIKDVENRTWETAYRGQFILHAGKKLDAEAYRRLSPYHEFRELPSGILGVCELVSCSRVVSSGWHEPGYWGLYLMNPRRFPQPIPFRGMQCFFDVPDDVVRQAMEDIDV